MPSCLSICFKNDRVGVMVACPPTPAGMEYTLWCSIMVGNKQNKKDHKLLFTLMKAAIYDPCVSKMIS
jgi:hypothetical protein